MVERSCSKCKGKNLHPGDQVSFGGNKSEFSTSDLQKSAKFLGIRVHGLSKQVKYLISKNKSNSKTVAKARTLGIKVITPEQFQVKLKNVCDGLIQNFNKRPFKSLILEGSRVYTLGLTDSDLSTLEKFLKSKSAKSTKIMNSSLSAAVSSKFMLKSDKAKQLQGLNIPIYEFSKLRLKPIRD